MAHACLLMFSVIFSSCDNGTCLSVNVLCDHFSDYIDGTDEDCGEYFISSDSKLLSPLINNLQNRYMHCNL